MIDIYELAKKRISMAENVTEKFVEVRKNLEYRKRPEYKRKHKEYMRIWRQKNENYRERNKLRMRLRRKKLKELATTLNNHEVTTNRA